MGKRIRCWNCRALTSRERGATVAPADWVKRLETNLSFSKVFEGNLSTKQDTALVELCDGCEHDFIKLQKFYTKFMKSTKQCSKIHQMFRTSTFWDFPIYNEDGEEDVADPHNSSIHGSQSQGFVNNTQNPKVKTKRKGTGTAKEGTQKKIKIKIEKSPEPKTPTVDLTEENDDAHGVPITHEQKITTSTRLKAGVSATPKRKTRIVGMVVNPADQPHIPNGSGTNLLEGTRIQGSAINSSPNMNLRNPVHTPHEEQQTCNGVHQRNPPVSRILASRKIKCVIKGCNSAFVSTASKIAHERIQHPGFVSDHTKFMVCNWCKRVYTRSKFQGVHLPRCKSNPFRTVASQTNNGVNVRANLTDRQMRNRLNRGYRFNVN